MAPYIRLFRSQLYGKGQGNVEITESMGKVAINFFQDGSVCRFRFDPQKMNGGSDGPYEVWERALRSAIGVIHSSSKQGVKCSQFGEEQELHSIRLWLGDLQVPGDGTDAARQSWPSIAERRVDFDRASTVHAVKSAASTLGLANAKSALLRADVNPAVVRRVFSARGRKRADKRSV